MRKIPGKINVARGATKGKMLDKRQRNNSECEDGRVGRDLKKRLQVQMRRKEGTLRSYTTGEEEEANIWFYEWDTLSE
jgi:hypothetical protein